MDRDGDDDMAMLLLLNGAKSRRIIRSGLAGIKGRTKNGSVQNDFALLDDRVGLRQVVAVPVSNGIVDEPDSSSVERLVEQSVLLWPHHPPPIHPDDDPRLR